MASFSPADPVPIPESPELARSVFCPLLDDDTIVGLEAVISGLLGLDVVVEGAA